MQKNKITLIGGRMFEKYLHNPCNYWRSLRIAQQWGDEDILNPNSNKVTQVVNEGQLSIIKPNVAHTMVFTKDTTFLNLVRGERDHENYGITHTIRHVFVDE